MDSKQVRLLRDRNDLFQLLIPKTSIKGVCTQIRYTDGCICSDHGLHSWHIKWGKRAMLQYKNNSPEPYDFDWAEQDHIEICPWNSVEEIAFLKGTKNIAVVDQRTVISRIDNDSKLRPVLPHLAIHSGALNLICAGTPRSERSVKGKRRTKDTVLELKSKICSEFTCSERARFEVFVEIFTENRTSQADIDRLMPPILDAFNGVVWSNDRQVDSIHPRFFDTHDLFVKLECRTEPMFLAEIASIPVGSLSPLLYSNDDYYVVRIRQN